jgi:hypothetical protein
MGHGTYSYIDRSVRATSSGYYTAPVEQIFTERKINQAMDPKGVMLRESRDSDNHPKSVAVVVALDVTGSMLTVPHEMVKDGLPTMVSTIIQGGNLDPQVLFLAIGDHECDRAPLQVGQFESGDEELDKWLTSIYLESGGGGNDGESYLLAWYFAGLRTSIDCFEKRGQKGLLFTIGDEPCLRGISESHLKKVFGDGQYSSYRAEELLALAREKYHVYHINVEETGTSRSRGSVDKWKTLIGENLINVYSHTEIPQKIAEVVNRLTLHNDEVTVSPAKTDSSTDTNITEML